MRRITTAGILLAGIVYLAWLALVTPEIEFLRPSWQGEWIVHPHTPIAMFSAPVCPDAVFERQVVVTSPPSTPAVSISALRGFRLDVNQVRRVATQTAPSWKRTVRLDLGPYLVAGTNVLRVTVSGHDGPPALLVEGPPGIRTDTNWTVRLAGAGPVQAVVAGKAEPLGWNAQGALGRDPRHRLFGWLIAIYVALVAYALIPVRFRPCRPASATPGQDPGVLPAPPSPRTAPHEFRALLCFFRHHGACLAMLSIVAVAQYRNTAVYPYSRSPFDVDGHVDYVRLAAEKARVPMATDGWEMFQPPAYYFTAAAVYRLSGGRAAEPRSLKAVQVFTTTCGLLTLVMALGLLYLVFPDRPLPRTLGFAAVAFLPVHFYMDPMITNEVFAGAMIAGALLVAIWALRSANPSWLRVTAAALACGLALLSKYSALFLVLAVGIWLGLRALGRLRNLRAWGVLLCFAAGVLLTCGWYYQRNVAAYGKVFIGNWDYASGFHYEQPPGYRTAGFYARFGAVLFDNPERSRWASFWDGQYGSLWADSHEAFLRAGDAKTDLLVATILWLALLPTAACVLGFGMAVASLLRRRWDDPLLILVLTTFLSLVGTLAFTMEVPTFSTIKAFFLLGLISPAAVFAGLGLEAMVGRLGRLRWTVYASLAALAILVLHVYQFVP